MRGYGRRSLAAAFFAAALLLPGAALSEDLGEQATTGCAVADQGGYTLCLGFESLNVDGAGVKTVPYGELDSHGMLRGHYLGLGDFGVVDVSLVYNGGTNYDLDATLHGDRTSLHLKALGLTRNIGHLDMPPSAALTFTSQDMDPSDDYSLDATEAVISLRIKPVKSYPAHLGATVRRFTKEGDIQQQFLNENCASMCHLVSQTRAVKTTTDQVQLGADAHIGYLDVSLNLNMTQFADEKDDPAFYYESLPGFVGTREHNAYPDLSSTEQILTLSTSAVGRLSGAFSLGMGERENESAGLLEKYQKVKGQMVYRAGTRMTLLLDTRQYAVQDDAPSAGSALEVQRLADGSPLQYGQVENKHRAVLSYHPSAGFDVRGEVVLKETEREDNLAWGLPGKTTSNETRVTASYHPSQSFHLNACVGATSTDDPPYASTPTDSSRASIGAQWNPRANLILSADVKTFSGENTQSSQSSDRRLLNASVTYSPTPPLLLTLYFLSYEDDTTADLTFDGPSLTVVTDRGVPYRARGSQVVLQGSWDASDKVRLSGDVSLVTAEGSYSTDQAPFADVDDYSRMDAMQNEAALTLLYGISENMDLTARVARLKYEDDANPEDEETVNRMFAAVTKRW